MAVKQAMYACSHCGAQSLKWSGRCFECGKWGTLAQTMAAPGAAQAAKLAGKLAADPAPLSDVRWEKEPRARTGIGEFDAVLGGGIVNGSLILLGGDPGIGKSTLCLQILQAFGTQPSLPLYVSGEESGQQIKLRADRLGIDSSRIRFLAETNVEIIAETIAKTKPSLVVIDSIQTISSAEAESEPGSVTQVRACTVKLLESAKTSHVPVLLVGHVTKDGQVAGPKTLEHLVDTVLYLEGDRYQVFRILRTVKNRFGPTNEVGLFSMEDKGLHAVANPSALFIASDQPMPGSAVTCVFEGTRPFLIEIQALVTKTSYAAPQRRASGYDVNRLQLLLAVLNQRSRYSFAAMDVHLNVVGGLKIQDPATDLAVCAALISAQQNKPLPAKTIVLGEVGLAGETRPVRQLAERLKEALKLGYAKAYIPSQKIKVTADISTIPSVESLTF